MQRKKKEEERKVARKVESSGEGRSWFSSRFPPFSLASKKQNKTQARIERKKPQMDGEVISTAQDAYAYLTGVYKEAAPRFYESFLEIGTKRIVCDWLEEEEIILPPGEEAKFMKMLDKELNFFERKNYLPSFFC